MSLCINPHCPKPQNPDTEIFCQACGWELLLAGRYRIIRLLSGKGGFGRTYLVNHNGKDRVLKLLINPIPKAVTVILESLAELDQILNPPLPPPKPKKPIVGVSAPPPSKLGRRKIIQLAGLDRYRGGFNCDRTSFGKMWLWIRVYRRAHFLIVQV